MLGATGPLLATGEILLGSAAVRGAFTAQPLGIAALLIATVVALFVVVVGATHCKSSREKTVVHLPSGARVTICHG